APEPAQASVGREQERVAGPVAEPFGDHARLVEEVACLALLDSGEAADLEPRDARGELQHQGLARLRNGGEERGDPTAVPRPLRRGRGGGGAAPPARASERPPGARRPRRNGERGGPRASRPRVRGS